MKTKCRSTTIGLLILGLTPSAYEDGAADGAAI